MIDTFYQPSVLKAQCNIGTEKNPDIWIICVYGYDNFFQAYTEVLFCSAQ